jgi:hypothetical protein
MANRAGFDHAITWSIVVVILATFFPSVPFLVGCGVTEDWVTRHCADNANPRVSENRVVTMVAINYLYTNTTGDYDQNARSTIPAAYEVANRIFREEGINLQILSLSVNDRNIPGMNIQGGSPNIPAMVEVHHGASAYVGVHWPEWVLVKGSDKRSHGAGDLCPSEACNWLILGGQLRNGGSVEGIGRILAKTFGFYLNLDELGPDPTNLMSKTDIFGAPGPGTDLTIEQRDIMWAAINSGRPALTTVTCDPPVALAPRHPNPSQK